MPEAGDFSKVLTRAELLARRQAARAAGRRVVQCHGCFDIVHPGHVRHLRHAKTLGDLLLVTITGDGGVRKGDGRPLIPEELRAENLAALDFVDWVYVEHRPTAVELLEDTQPDVYVKGREYEFNDDPRFRAERETVERRGGRVIFSSGDVVFSSSALIAAMEQSADPFHARLAQLARDPRLSQNAIESLIADFRAKRLVVAGETILDAYVFCDRPEVAGESPVLTLRPLQRRQYDGGAAVVARHAAALGARPILVTALPDSAEAALLRQRLAADGVEVRAVTVRGSIPEKQRFIVGQQKILKLDLLEPLTLDAAQQDAFEALAREAAEPGADAAVITDFGLGLFSPPLIARLCAALRPRARILAGDVSGKRSHLTAFHEADLLAPSETELRDATHLHDEGLPAVVWRLLEVTSSRAAIVTLGAEGLIGFDRLPGEPDTPFTTRLRAEHVPALCPLAIDPLGCGDALLTVATLALASNAPILAASYLGALAAAVQVQRLGNTPVSAADLRRTAARLGGAHLAFVPAELDAAPRRAAFAS